MPDDIICVPSGAVPSGPVVGGTGPIASPAARDCTRLSAALPETAADGMRPLVEFTGKGRDLFVIFLGNVLFTVFTMGVYAFWAKVRVRKYLWAHTVVLGEPLEYTGTGGELCKSFLHVSLFSMAGMIAFYAVATVLPFAALLPAYLVFIPLKHFATFQALRYRLTRTRWRGIRGNMDGSAARYAVIGAGYSLLTFLTLFLCLPLEIARLTGKRYNAALFGTRRFRFSGTGRSLFGAWAKIGIPLALLFAGTVFWGHSFVTGPSFGTCPIAIEHVVVFIVFVSLLLAGILLSVFRAAVIRWQFASLTYGSMRFDARSYTAWGLLTLKLGNALLLVFTLGLALPWVIIRSHRFFVTSLRYAGDPELQDIFQDTLPQRSRGEGLLDALDMDLSF